MRAAPLINGPAPLQAGTSSDTRLCEALRKVKEHMPGLREPASYKSNHDGREWDARRSCTGSQATIDMNNALGQALRSTCLRGLRKQIEPLAAILVTGCPVVKGCHGRSSPCALSGPRFRLVSSEVGDNNAVIREE